LGVTDEHGFLVHAGEKPANIDSLLRPGPVCVEQTGRLLFSEPLVRGGLVYVFGGGHIAQELVPLLVHLDFRCVVFDDRKEFSKADLFPGAEKVILGDFENIGKYVTLTENDYTVIVTRGHLWDLEAWAFALDSSAAYIGVIGSKSKHEFVKEKLTERGFSPDQINALRVHAPIGMDIKSDTPAEIAVSIAGELIRTRASGNLPA
jgi:xanthine dehydrogenase accessory factor